jgi:hypothetical protein
MKKILLLLLLPQFILAQTIVSDEYIPNYIREYVAKQGRKIEYRFSYKKNGDALLSYGMFGDYIVWNQSKTLSTNYAGDKFYWMSLKQEAINEQNWKSRMEDPIFAEIEAIIYQIGVDMDYDWASFNGRKYRYENPNTIKGVCSDFTYETINRLSKHPLLESIELWSSNSHAWNVLNLKDGRKLYCDTTWYEGNNVKNGVVLAGCMQVPYNLTFDEAEFNSQGFCTKPGGGYLKIHNDWPTASWIKFIAWQ